MRKPCADEVLRAAEEALPERHGALHHAPDDVLRLRALNVPRGPATRCNEGAGAELPRCDLGMLVLYITRALLQCRECLH